MEMIKDSDELLFSNELKVPHARVAVIIGHKGATKRELGELFGVNIDVDSGEGLVVVSGTDSLKVYVATEVVKAIARGFNPEIAKRLIKPDYVLEIVRIDDYARNKNGLQRLKGRVIGLKGKSRATLERLSETSISVYGKTVAIIGENENAMMAKRAVEELLAGAMHSTVFKKMERERRRLAALRF